jgi:hypothetical protein
MNNMRDLIILAESVDLVEAGAGPSRILSHIRRGMPFFMVSAFRQHLPHEENLKRSEMLKKKLAEMPGLSFIETTGEYQEDGNEMPGVENSFFVLPRSRNTNAKYFVEMAKRLGHLFQQESVLVGDGEAVFLVFMTADHEPVYLGTSLTFNLKAIEKVGAFSKIKNRKFSFADPDQAPEAVPYGAARKQA